MFYCNSIILWDHFLCWLWDHCRTCGPS